jgi:CheY-like chemotaxis protein
LRDAEHHLREPAEGSRTPAADSLADTCSTHHGSTDGEKAGLAIVDLEMPNFDGLDLIKSVRGNPMLKHIPIIVLTGNESREALDGALAAGATSFLLKPLNWSAFGEHIRLSRS